MISGKKWEAGHPGLRGDRPVLTARLGALNLYRDRSRCPTTDEQYADSLVLAGLAARACSPCRLTPRRARWPGSPNGCRLRAYAFGNGR